MINFIRYKKKSIKNKLFFLKKNKKRKQKLKTKIFKKKLKKKLKKKKNVKTLTILKTIKILIILIKLINIKILKKINKPNPTRITLRQFTILRTQMYLMKFQVNCFNNSCNPNTPVNRIYVLTPRNLTSLRTNTLAQSFIKPNKRHNPNNANNHSKPWSENNPTKSVTP
jgi:hypothetical protein